MEGCRNLEKMRALEAISAKTRARGPEHPAVLMAGFRQGEGRLSVPMSRA